jgi:branched-chain amino acid transport system permease protein
VVSYRQLQARRDARILEDWIRPRITPALIAEHRRDPFGRHSADLDIVLTYLRRVHDALVIVEREPGRYAVAELPRERAGPLRIDERTVFQSEEQAAHAILERQLEASGLAG